MKLGDKIKVHENVENLWKICGDNEEHEDFMPVLHKIEDDHQH